MVAYGVFVFYEAFVQEFLVVYVATFHLQCLRERFGTVNGVTHPFYIAEVVLVAFVDVDVYVYVLFVVWHNAVGVYNSVAVAPFVVLVDYQAFVLFILFGKELFAFKKVVQLVYLVRLLHRAFEFLDVFLLYAGEVDVFYFYLFVLVDVHVDDNLVRCRYVVFLNDFDNCVFISLFFEVTLYYDFCTVDDVGRNLASASQAEPFLYILAFRFLYSVVGDC